MNSSPANSNDSKFAVIGCGGHAKVVACLIRELGFEIVGHIAPVRGAAFFGDYLGTDTDFLDRHNPADLNIALGIGIPKVSPERILILDKFTVAGFRAPPLIASGATVSKDAKIGDGTVVFNGANIAPGTRLGRCCIANHLSNIDHDCDIESNVHIAPGTILCGNVRVAKHSLIGARSILLPGVSISEKTLVKAGEIVKHS